jgi:hypothetical protein
MVEGTFAITEKPREVAANDSAGTTNASPTMHVDAVAAVDEIAHLVEDFSHLQYHRHTVVANRTTQVIDGIGIKRVREIVRVRLEFARLGKVEDMTDPGFAQQQQTLFRLTSIRAPGVRPRE